MTGLSHNHKPNPNPNPTPNRNANVVADLRNKKNSFSYVHTVRPFRNLDYSDPSDQQPFGVWTSEQSPPKLTEDEHNCTLHRAFLEWFMDFSFPRHFVPNMLWTIRSLDDSFCGRFVPWTFRSLDVSYHRRQRSNMDTIIVFVSVIRRIYEVNLI